jgi:hypothetical protein
MNASRSTQDEPRGAGPIASMPALPALTPRAQLLRVVAASTLALVLGAGPAIAWDASTQLPRVRGAAAAAARPSPWKGAALRLRRVLRGVARAYLPREWPAAEDGSERPLAVSASLARVPAASASAATSAAPTVVIEPMPVTAPEIE